MKKLDHVQRFLFEHHPIRGQHVSLDRTWEQIAKQVDIEGRGLTLLGEALVVVSLLVDTLKIEGSITLQIRGTGPLTLLVVEANSDQKVRGTIRKNADLSESDDSDLKQLFGSDYLVITIHTEGAEPHQGIVPLQGHRLAEAMENYFSTSEQLPTHFWLACDEQNASGMLIQKLPGKSSDDDAWDRVQHLASTISEEELQALPLEQFLHRLFHEEALRLFDASPIEFSCSCSRERTSGMLLSLGKQEVLEILDQENEISISCEFCNEHYRFDQVDVEQVFGRSDTLAPTSH